MSSTRKPARLLNERTILAGPPSHQQTARKHSWNMHSVLFCNNALKASFCWRSTVPLLIAIKPARLGKVFDAEITFRNAVDIASICGIQELPPLFLTFSSLRPSLVAGPALASITARSRTSNAASMLLKPEMTCAHHPAKRRSFFRRSSTQSTCSSSNSSAFTRLTTRAISLEALLVSM